MNVICYCAGAIAIMSALLVITRRNPMHALLHLIVLLLALGLVFYALGAPLMAVLEVAIYAGAIIVLFVFVVLMLKLVPSREGEGIRWPGVGVWATPVFLALALLALGIRALGLAGKAAVPIGVVGPKQVGLSLYSEYLVAVEVASLLILAGLIGAFHLAPPTRHGPEELESADAQSSEQQGEAP